MSKRRRFTNEFKQEVSVTANAHSQRDVHARG